MNAFPVYEDLNQPRGIWCHGNPDSGELEMLVPFPTALRQPDNHPAFTTGSETHGFASLLRSRFAFIVLQSFQKDQITVLLRPNSFNVV